jgi:hypothetical protein
MLLQRLPGAALFCGGFLAAQPAASPRVERGRSLAEEKSRRQERHTPKTESGEFDKARWMEASVLGFALLKPVADGHRTLE